MLFADYVNKVNPVGKVQKRGLVVTEANIYKHHPKTYAVIKFGTPIGLDLKVFPNNLLQIEERKTKVSFHGKLNMPKLFDAYELDLQHSTL